MTDNKESEYEKQTREAGEKTRRFLYWVASVWLGFAIVAGVVSYSFLSENASGFWLSGTYGDMFGVINALFTGGALVGVWHTIQLQRIELSTTREELKRTAESMAAQAAVLKKQEFEGTFFQLLRRLGETVDQMTYSDKMGREAIHALYYRFAQNYEKALRAQPDADRKVLVRKTYADFLDGDGHILKHYFRIMFHVLKQVDTSGLSQGEKNRYASMARAQLSTYELAHLLYDVTCQDEHGPLLLFVERYALLKHIFKGVLAGQDSKHMEMVSPQAYRGTM